MGAFDVAKAKIAQGLGYSEQLPTAEAKGTGLLSKGLGNVFNDPVVSSGLNAINKVQTLVKGVSGLVKDIKSVIHDPTLLVPNPLLNGWSRKELISLLEHVSKIDYAKQNVFLIRIEDNNYPDVYPAIRGTPLHDGDQDPTGKGYGVWDMFVINVSYNQVTVNGDPVRIGALHSDSVQQMERTEYRVTFLDNTQATIKKFFAQKAGQTINPDGTVNPPKQYSFLLKVIHCNHHLGRQMVMGKPVGVFNLSQLTDTQQNYISSRLVRVASLDVDLNRREDGLQELQATFVEVDPFMR